MARSTYPKLGSSAWQTLRERAATTPSIKFAPATVATIMGLGSTESATTNIVRPMRQLGLIGEEWTLTERGCKWRVEATYGDACQEILDKVYPPELASFTDANGTPDRSQVTTWFQHKGFGNSNARQMASTYLMIAEKKVPTAAKSEQKKANRTPVARKTPAAKVTPPVDEGLDTQVVEPPPRLESQPGMRPDLHVDIQIHISADATVEQIDQIFASMAKHLYQT